MEAQTDARANMRFVRHDMMLMSAGNTRDDERACFQASLYAAACAHGATRDVRGR